MRPYCTVVHMLRRVDLEIPVSPELERQLLAMKPWMHPFRFGPDTIVGWFKHHTDETETVCLTTSAAPVKETFRRAYSDYSRGQPRWHSETLVSRFGAHHDWLDIACATGRHSFELALRGARSV